jgi:hypothetical protein
MHKGKVSRDEWPAIVRRHEAGDSFAVISRDYGCSAPAIRYIVNRFESAPHSRKSGLNLVGGAEKRSALDAANSEGAGAQRAQPDSADALIDRALHGDTFDLDGEELIAAGQATGDIASFLGALDATLTDRSRENLTALLVATDRLMFLAARMRLSVEALARRLERT